MRPLYFLPLLVLLLPMLQGCFPVVAGGVGAGVMMADDRRTSGTYIEDEGIEIKASSRLADKFKDQAHINLTSFNRNVLMTGEAGTEAARTEAESIVRGVPNVRQVINEIAIAGNSAFSARSNDTYLTTKVKARMIDASKFSVNHVKVVTENGIVYLIGLVKHKEADDAVEIARTTDGVQKVVKLFEYID